MSKGISISLYKRCYLITIKIVFVVFTFTYNFNSEIKIRTYIGDR